MRNFTKITNLKEFLSYLLYFLRYDQFCDSIIPINKKPKNSVFLYNRKWFRLVYLLNKIELRSKKHTNKLVGLGFLRHVFDQQHSNNIGGVPVVSRFSLWLRLIRAVSVLVRSELWIRSISIVALTTDCNHLNIKSYLIKNI